MTDWWSGLIASIMSGQGRVSILSTEQLIERGGGATVKPAQTQSSLARYCHSRSSSNSHVKKKRRDVPRCCYWPVVSPLQPQFQQLRTSSNGLFVFMSQELWWDMHEHAMFLSLKFLWCVKASKFIMNTAALCHFLWQNLHLHTLCGATVLQFVLKLYEKSL